MISYPEQPWERVGDLPADPKLPHVNVNEGPEVLLHANDIFVIYSGSACWTDYYELGMVRAHRGDNLLDPASWHKSENPVFTQNRVGGVFGPGHNGFFLSPDGRQNWIIYHANDRTQAGCGNERSPRIQRFNWNEDGTPNFGAPVPTSEALQKPAGTPE